MARPRTNARIVQTAKVELSSHLLFAIRTDLLTERFFHEIKRCEHVGSEFAYDRVIRKSNQDFSGGYVTRINSICKCNLMFVTFCDQLFYFFNYYFNYYFINYLKIQICKNANDYNYTYYHVRNALLIQILLKSLTTSI